MPNIRLEFPHRLPRPAARQRVDGLVSDLRRQYAGQLDEVTATWHGDTLHVELRGRGQTVTGQFHVEDHQVRVEVHLPWLLSPHKGQLQQEIEKLGGRLQGS